MDEYKIETSVPVPGHKGTGRKATYPLLAMNVGESFVVPFNLGGQLRHTAYKHASHHKRKYTIRVVIENGVKIVRCWRTA